MPDITEREQNEYAAFRSLQQSPEDLRKLVTDHEKLKAEAATRRTENTALKTENEALKTKVPDGAVILTGDEATAFMAINSAGLTLAQVNAGLAERDTLKAEKAAREREDLVRIGIKGEGWANEDDVLRSLSGRKEFDGLKLEKQEREVDVVVNGKTEKQKRSVVIVTPEGGTAKQLGEWFKEADPLGFAAASGAKPNGTTTTIRETAVQATVATSGGGSAAGGIDDLIAENQKAAKAGNPLAPRKTA